MSTVKVEVAHEGAHEPAAESFTEDFGKALTSALHDAGLKRGEGFEHKIDGYVNTSGVSTVYNVEVIGTEPSAEALKAKEKADAEAKSNTGGGSKSADAKNAEK